MVGYQIIGYLNTETEGGRGVPLQVIFQGVFPLVGAVLVSVILLTAFPEIATFLPGLISY